jgi:hypothetical protein
MCNESLWERRLTEILGLIIRSATRPLKNAEKKMKFRKKYVDNVSPVCK